MTVLHPNGLGESLGDALVVEGSVLFTAGEVWYVNSATGSDSNYGKERLQPYATLAQAVTDSAAGDIIVLQSGHAETLTSVQTVSKRLTIVGAGQSSGKPTVKLTNNQAAGSLLAFTAAGCELRNVWIEEESQANSSTTITFTESARIIGCYLEANGNTNGGPIDFGGSGKIYSVINSTFVSTATAATDAPTSMFQGTTTILRFSGCTFDGGTVGWANGFVYDENDGNAATAQIIFDQSSFLRGADLRLSDASSGWVQSSTEGGHPRIEWSASFG